MKALLSHQSGGPETLVLEDVTDPTPAARRASRPGARLRDQLSRRADHRGQVSVYAAERPFAPGGEVAGEVAALGDGVTGWSVGDRLIAYHGHGGLAEMVSVPASQAYHLPDQFPDAEAASLLITYATAIHALNDRGQAREGETMLVLGAAGGIGLSAIELGKAFGLRVVAAVSSEEKAEAARVSRSRRGARLSLRAARQGRLKGACRRVQGSRRSGRLRPGVRPGRRRLCRAGVALARLGRALSGYRLPGRHSRRSRSISPCSRAATSAASSGARSRCATPRPTRHTSTRCSACGARARSGPRSARPIRSSGQGEAIATLRDRKAVGKLVVTLD